MVLSFKPEWEVRFAFLSLTLKLLNHTAEIYLGWFLWKFMWSWKLRARTEDHSECAGHAQTWTEAVSVMSPETCGLSMHRRSLLRPGRFPRTWTCQESDKLRFAPWLNGLLIVWLEVNYLTALNLSFIICKTKLIIPHGVVLNNTVHVKCLALYLVHKCLTKYSVFFGFLFFFLEVWLFVFCVNLARLWYLFIQSDINVETALVVQLLRICLAIQGTWVWSLVMELRSHRPWRN